MKTLPQFEADKLAEIERVQTLAIDYAITMLAAAAHSKNRSHRLPNTQAVLYAAEDGMYFKIWDKTGPVFSGDYWAAVGFIAENYFFIED